MKQLAENPKIYSKIYSITSFLQPDSKSDVGHDFNHFKRKVMRYRLAFIGVGVLFVVLTATLFLRTPNWNFTFLFGHGLAAKTLISLITGSLAAASLWIGCHLRTEHELLRSYYKQISERLMRSFQKKRAPFHLGSLLSSSPHELEKEKNIRHLYLEAMDEIYRVASETDRYLDRINYSNQPESVKYEEKLELLKALKQHFDLTINEFESFQH